MEDYPPEYVEHNLPLILVCGLGTDGTSLAATERSSHQESGTRLTFESAQCSAERAKPILQQLLLCDSTPQLRTASTSTGTPRCRIKTTGKTYTLPSRKAAPLPQSPIGDPSPTKQGSNELHSPLSPISPGSPLFPDGIMSPLWFGKHQHQVPALILAFFEITANGGTTQDDAIKADINAVRTALNRSGFRVRFAAVLVSDRSIVQSSEVEESATAIRRATSLDAKTGIFFMPPMSNQEEISTFVASTLTTLQPVWIEYYRELTKHARRKKARGTVPNTPSVPLRGTGQTLSASSWNARYEIKQGVFAEFRHEIDVAERHYSQAIYDLCSDEGIFETAVSWSLRWDEARMLSDTLALRVIRCLLHAGLTTSAAQSWFEYRRRMRSIVETHGKNAYTYGWLAWESRWARVMAELVQAADLPALDNLTNPKHQRPAGSTRFLAYAAADKALSSFERLPPTYLLHHAGYWRKLALRSARARHASALAIPEEDRMPPGQSPASSFARKAQAYDTFLVPEPHDEYENAQKLGKVESMQLAEITRQASLDFSERYQQRMCDQLGLDLARDLVAEGAYDRAIEVLVPLWDATTWRQEQWHHLFVELLSLLHRCTKEVRNAEIALAVMWELSALAVADTQEENTAASMVLDELDLASDLRVAFEFQNAERLSPLSVGFAFENATAHAGEPVLCQVVLRSTAPQGSEPITVSGLHLNISTQEQIIVSNTDEEAAPASGLCDIATERDQDSFKGSTNLKIAPGQIRIFNLSIIFKESTLALLEKLTLQITGDRYRITHEIDDVTLLQQKSFYSLIAERLSSLDLHHLEESTSVNVLPKPPKVDFSIKNLKSQYSISEKPQLAIEILNNEAEIISGLLSVRALDQATEAEMPARILGLKEGNDEEKYELTLTDLAPAGTFDMSVSVDSPAQPTNCIATITIYYHLQSDPQATLRKQFDVQLQFVKLLDLKWTIEPSLYSEPWPSFFDSEQDDSTQHPSGIPQKWKAAFTAHSAVATDITIHNASLELSKPLSDAICSVESTGSVSEALLPKSGYFDRGFEFRTQKLSADDRRPITASMVCNIEWSYAGSEEKHIFTATVPQFSLPSSEPRVLCTRLQDTSSAADIIVNYHLENLSTHFLTFALTMEPSEEFAFNGVKHRSLSLAPLSRVLIAYGMVVHDRVETTDGSPSKSRWVSPSLQVVDSYYHKTLHVLPAGPGVKIDKDGKIAVLVEGMS